MYRYFICLMITLFLFQCETKSSNNNQVNDTNTLNTTPNPSSEFNPACEASTCHLSAPFNIYPPKSALHTPHLDKINPVTGNSIECYDCHNKILDNSLHENGLFNGYNPLSLTEVNGDVVMFDADNPYTRWDNTSGTCINVECHDNNSYLWNTPGTTDPSGNYSGTTNCLSCHRYAIESKAVSGLIRRAITPEFPDPSIDMHGHYGVELDNNSCNICHYIDAVSGPVLAHRSGAIYLYDSDNNITGEFIDAYNVYVIENNGNLSANHTTVNLSNFCLSCHDSDGAARLTVNAMNPFGNANAPPDVSVAYSGTMQWQDNSNGYNYYGSSSKMTNSRHDVLKSDEMNSSKMDCLDCHGSHTSTLSQPIINPWATTRPYTGTRNEFCLECHSGGENPIEPAPEEINPYKKQFPDRIAISRAMSVNSNNEYNLEFTNWINFDLGSMTEPWMNTGDYVFNITNFSESGTLIKEISASDIICIYNPVAVSCNGSMNVKGDFLSTSSDDIFEFRYCPWWDPGCDITNPLEYYTNGTASIAAIELTNTGLSGRVSFIKGLSSGGYTMSPWSVKYSWKFSHHGSDSKRTWNNWGTLSRYSEAGSTYSAELQCSDCHDKHGSGNYYMIKNDVSGVGKYYDDGQYGGTLISNPSGTITSPFDIIPVTFPRVDISNPPDGTYDALNYYPLCVQCHNFDLSNPGGAHVSTFDSTHSDLSSCPDCIPCSNCHGHGGSDNQDGWLTTQSQDTSIYECGNGIIDGNPALNLHEECDDGNTANGDGCTNACQIETPKPSQLRTEHIPSKIIYDQNTGVLLGTP